MADQEVVRVQHAFGVIATLMITSYMFPKQAVVKDFEVYDFVIVGAGSAGSVIADRLSECSNNRVLAIEAGGDPPMESVVPALFPYMAHSKYDFNITSLPDNFTAQGHNNEVYGLTCGRMLGGGSSINYLLYARGCSGDYDSWAETVGDDQWSYQNVLPYFIKSERLENEEILNSPYGVYHGTDGFLGVTRENRNIATTRYLEAFGEAGHDILLDVNGKDSLGYSLPLYTIANGMRQSTAYTNLGANRDRPNLHVLKNTFVVEILFDSDNNAVGVKAITDDNKELTILARKEVIVSAGTYNTAKLLMLSGIGPKEHLQSLNIGVKSDVPVGMNFQDHLAFIMSFKMDESNAPAEPSDPGQHSFPIVVGYATVNKCQSCAEYQTISFVVPNDSKGPYEICTFNYGYKEEVCRKILEASKGRKMFFTNFNTLHPKSRGRVTLRSKNPHDLPIVNTGLFSDESDLEDLTTYLQDYISIMNTTYFTSVNSEIVDLELESCKEFQFGSREYWRCYVLYMSSTLYHSASTCTMGSVVDSQLRVKNVQRLRVADASVMPTLPSGNPNAAVIMIAEKVSDMIKNDHGCDLACS